jgi:hypothetical protein
VQFEWPFLPRKLPIRGSEEAHNMRQILRDLLRLNIPVEETRGWFEGVAIVRQKTSQDAPERHIVDSEADALM